ncbi:hypothetical protein GCM10011494_35940 [Novosphingobium endophyticum]|uniref:Response regulatory domain-containing protein n=1 Tax=Novosphingobium endophyticum TaxID=1955250 RepID=A0A916X7H9_9SPHN|nr:hypothetical protein GCM10011494_35940 [Novosphingobium endophyticum]
MSPAGGATTAHILGPWNELPAQIDALTDDTALVTVTIGVADEITAAGGKAIAVAGDATHAIPTIFLTGRAGVTDRVVGLEVGADDYVIKPFDRRELLARIRAVLRRTSRNASAQPA